MAVHRSRSGSRIYINLDSRSTKHNSQRNVGDILNTTALRTYQDQEPK